MTPRVWRPSDPPTYDGPLLLDTDVWIWHLDGDAAQIAPEAIALLDRSGGAARLHVSDISTLNTATS